MKRIDKIYSYMAQQSKEYLLKDIKAGRGFSAGVIAESLDMMRNNVSLELNNLLRADKIIKIKGRPVLFLDREIVEKLLGFKLQTGPLEVENFNKFIADDKTEEAEKNPFDSLIGYNTSLRTHIEQAKAAVLYPPNGLNTLIVGPTGVGKTLFANMMYKYAVYVKRLEERSPFVLFNCADYYNNPQLLLSHMFGHIKGAFTGADSEKEGLVAKANGGILFLDEIHRLPPEGQEMIFYFIDTGTYGKLGETERNRKSTVRIIGATTEDPASSLLKTFVRRIPIVISLPNLEERPGKDKLDIVKFLLANEAHRVNKQIKVEGEAVKAIIGSASYGNIGQMKSNIQLVCANGFLNSINNKDFIEIDFKSLPSDIKNGIFSLSSKKMEEEELSQYFDNQMVVMPQGFRVLIEEDSSEPTFNLYKIIEDKAAILKDEGADDEYIKKFITTDINIHLKCFYKKGKNIAQDREKILKLVNEDTLQFAEEVKVLVEVELNRKFSERFLYAFSLHISAFLKRIESRRSLKYTNIKNTINDKQQEFKISLKIKDLIEKKYNIVVPDMEVIYLTLLISSVQEEQNNQRVAVIVALHGSSTASSMVNVAKKLLGEGVVESVDMPLDVGPQRVLNDIIEKVNEIDMGRGVLLLVDMGSLTSFDSIITEKTGIRVKTVDMTSTPLVLEAVRKANMLDMDLDTLYDSLKDFKGYGTYSKDSRDLVHQKNKAIITICSTGEGTAKKLKELVNNIVINITRDEIIIIPIGVTNIKAELKELMNQYTILVTVGIMDPKIDAPFISIEKLIGGDGEKRIIDIIQKNNIPTDIKEENIVVKELCEDSLTEFLTFLNPHKIISVLMNFISVLEKEMDKNFINSFKIKLMIHVGCALERMVIKETLIYGGDSGEIDAIVLKYVEEAALKFKEALNIRLTEDEIYYICEIFTEQYNELAE
ncbi:sigma 54-interacting transcriptional regulator [Clostridium bowmanii]|uniref:sigma 54-interacting transcriptional regulator n=1 Tax=Clostridium bowmanii TaxID=132925 RepID=UPI001C0D22B2|nr:sigma-54-dependent transcriptional regulator [Clostridium bowmanii]MBU3191726.1 sigma 54-interacting transcriptional regulator [Clostridium bowmanii]MCA1076039.1 sigma 54-interacting transcriptional regulator [Clostridium bowmanii]